MRIGFIGLGTMGLPMAQHLMRAGHSLGAYARRAEALAPLTATGATAFATPGELAAASDVVITMVTATPDVDQVLFASRGVMTGAHRGLLVIDMSTIAPPAAIAFAARLRDAGVAMLDAPVSGGPAGARDAKLTIMAGGSADAFERARPLFESLGTNIFHVGDNGAGQITKACHQLLLLVTAEGVAEALSLAGAAGVDPGLVRQVMMTGIASSRVLDLFGGRMAARQFEPGISVRLYRKDLQIVRDLATSAGVSTPAGEGVAANVQKLVSEGLEREDLAALIKVLEQTATGYRLPTSGD